ncbi:hypothetical protein [Gilvimarinus sp. DA14]|uniref:hypothetical protein n=1 Tax=Gilvimarinus sp. DA14 TaxID=2956798 RepID=UPI0020B6BD13|nr:hypothetical protein [Gilvimarinus sp. DA14]UTF58840.1 hypothetical protein NHM04_10140 [Gilvimarinus sp. DA14]
MSKFIDVSTGAVCIAGEYVQKECGVPRAIIPDEEIDMENGWKIKIFKNIQIGGFEGQIALHSYLGTLNQATVGFNACVYGTIEDRFSCHNKILKECLGKPSDKNDISVSYIYEWGRVSSVLDKQKSMSSVIKIHWSLKINRVRVVDLSC